MHITHKDKINNPFNTPNGEVIYELIGRAVEPANQGHSLAYIVIPPGKASVLHYHPIAEESYYILKGVGQLQLGDEETTVHPGQAILIPPPMPHKISNPGSVDLEFLAICAPAWEANNSVWLE